MRWFGRSDSSYREELEAHIAIEVQENIERGMSAEAARQAALRSFGNAMAVREQLGEERPLHFWRTLYRDLQYGARLMRRTPGLTVTIVLTLALGIGANAAIFSLVQAILLRMLPVRDPGSLVIVRALTRMGVGDWFSHTDYEWLRDHNRVFLDLAGTANWKFVLDAGDHKERVGTEFVSGNYFSMLGLEPAAGRLVTTEDDREARPVAVISYGFWLRAFGGSESAIGKELRIEKTALEVVGVAPRGFRGEYVGDAPDLWVPLNAQAVISGPKGSMLRTRQKSWLGVLGRLRPGVSLQQARAEMRPLLEGLRADLHVDGQNDYLGAIGIEAGGGGLSKVRDYYSEPLEVLMALVALVLLIACANAANLLMARAAARRREFAVRLAIGASRGRLVRQLMTESFVLAALACGLGVWIGDGLVRALVALSDVKGLEVHLNPVVLLFTVAISVMAAVAFGLAPALQGRRVDPWTTLKEGRMGPGAMGRYSLSSLLVAGQSALSIVLLIAAGLLARTLVNLKSVNVGFDQEVLEANLDLSLTGENGVAVGRRLVERIGAVPGVGAVSFAQYGFGQGGTRACCMSPEGYTPQRDEDKNIRMQMVGPGYFHVMGISIVEGREFAPSDRYGAARVTVINETTARYYFRGESAVGKRIAFWPTDPKDIEIVGVVRDAKYDNLKQSTPRMVFMPAYQQGASANFVQIRGVGRDGRGAAALMADCRAAVRSVNGNIRVVSLAPLRTAVDRTLTPELLVSSVASGFGVLALLMTSVGLYGILAYAVARRTAEFGIREALGAGRATILRMVMGEGLRLVGAGVAVGAVAAVVLGRFVTKLLFGVGPYDWVSFAGAAVVLLVVGAAASYGPARRATSVEPVCALRWE